MEVIEELERICNDLFTSTLVNVFSDLKERLSSFQSSFSTYKLVFQKALSKVLPAIRGGGGAVTGKHLGDSQKLPF